MIRNPIRLGVLTAENDGRAPLNIPTGHGGTISQLIFLVRNGAAAATIAATKTALSNLTLEVTHQKEGTFALLNKATPKYLLFREQFFYEALGITNEAGVLTYDPAAGVGKDEIRRDQLTIGCQDLTNMVLTPEWAADVTGVSHIEVWADIDYNLVQPLGEHIRVGRSTDKVLAAGGEVEITELPVMDATFGYMNIHMEEEDDGGGNSLLVDNVTIEIDGKQFPYKSVKRSVIERLLKYCYRKPQSGVFSLDFNKEDISQYVLPAGMKQFKITPEFTATGAPTGGNFNIWYELIHKAG